MHRHSVVLGNITGGDVCTATTMVRGFLLVATTRGLRADGLADICAPPPADGMAACVRRACLPPRCVQPRMRGDRERA